MKWVYQIGDVPLFGSLVDDIEISESRSWSAKRTFFQQTSGYFDHVPEGRRFFEAANADIKGKLSSKDNRMFLHIMSRVKAMSGLRDMPLIVCEVQSLDIDPTVRWLITRGTVTSVDDSSAYGSEDDQYYLKDFSIKMQIDYAWRPLLGWYWEDRPATSFSMNPTTQNGLDNMFILPRDYADITKTNYFQEWGDDYSRLEPFVWPLLYQGGKGYGADYTAFRSMYINAVEQIWAAPPVTLYAFTDLLPQGELSITANGRVSTLDLYDLDGQLLDRGLEGLFPSDEIFAGSENFIRRNGSILALIPEWDYDDAAPGELRSGMNYVTVAGDNTTGRFAINSIFGAL